MAEVAALFKQFLYRDLAFILGGFIVLLSLAYAFRGCIPSHWQEYWEKFPIPSTVLIAAAAYVVGYAVQDVGGVLRLYPLVGFSQDAFSDGCINASRECRGRIPIIRTTENSHSKFAWAVSKFPTPLFKP